MSLETEKGLEDAVARSHREPVVLFKHSAWCGLSTYAHRELSKLTQPDDPPVYCIVVQHARRLTTAVEERFGIRHESPQVIVLFEGKPVFDASHGRVTAEAVRQAARQAA